MCIIYTKHIYNHNLYTLTDLNVSNCPNLTSEKLQEILIQCKNLESLRCIKCLSLTSLDLQNNKKLYTLECSECTSLASIDVRQCENLNTLFCIGCKSLTCLDLRENKRILMLWCCRCSSLTSLLNKYTYGYAYNYMYKDSQLLYFGCPWIIQNRNFPSNLQRLIKIQRWYRRILIIKYMKSKQFIQWIYSPNIGGKYCKKQLLCSFVQ